MDSRALAKERYLLLIEQLTEELGSERQAAIAAKTDPSYPGKLRGWTTRHVGLEQLLETRKALGIRPEFFEDASLGPSPHYRDFLESSHDRGDAKGYAEVEAYIADMDRAGTPIAPEHAEDLRSWRRSRGNPEREEIVGYHRGMVAADARKALERPIVETKIDEARGQRKITPLRKKR
jgi:hypothetical protein